VPVLVLLSLPRKDKNLKFFMGDSCIVNESALTIRSAEAPTPSAPPILTACNGDGALGCNRVPGDAA
jgi:hypothetical protein